MMPIHARILTGNPPHSRWRLLMAVARPCTASKAVLRYQYPQFIHNGQATSLYYLTQVPLRPRSPNRLVLSFPMNS